MSCATLIVTVSAFAIAMMYVTARRFASRRVATDATEVAFPIHDWLATRGLSAGPDTTTPPPAGERAWQAVVVCDLRTAEELLDMLEANGYTHRQLVVQGNAEFLVRWQESGEEE